MFNKPAISMHELEVESAELLPSRETLCVMKAHIPHGHGYTHGGGCGHDGYGQQGFSYSHQGWGDGHQGWGNGHQGWGNGYSLEGYSHQGDGGWGGQGYGGDGGWGGQGYGGDGGCGFGGDGGWGGQSFGGQSFGDGGGCN